MVDIVEILRNPLGYSAGVSGNQAADEIERLRQRIEELEENDEIIREDYQRLLANAKRMGSELVELRKTQGAPSAWLFEYLHEGSWLKFAQYGKEKPMIHDDMRNVQPLYTSAPTIPEGWQLVPIMPTKKMIENAHLAEHCGNTDWHFVRAYSAMLAAAPKYGE